MGCVRPCNPSAPCPCRELRHSGVTVEEVSTPPSVLGWLDLAKGSVKIRRHLDDARRRSTLAHEMVHYDRGDIACDNLLDQMRVEQAVRTATANWLISLRDLAYTLAVSQTESEAAQRLRVDVQTLRQRVDALSPQDADYVERVVRRRAA